MWVLPAGGQRESSSLRRAILPVPCDFRSVSAPGESESVEFAAEFAVDPFRESSQVKDPPLRILQLAREVCRSGAMAGSGAGADALMS